MSAMYNLPYHFPDKWKFKIEQTFFETVTKIRKIVT